MGQVNLLSPLLPAYLWLLSTASLCHGYPQHSRNPTNDPALPSKVWGHFEEAGIRESEKVSGATHLRQGLCVNIHTL